MSSSTSGSDRIGHAEDATRLAWRRWLVVFCGAFFGIGALLFALLLLIDPYDTGRFPSFGIVGISDHSLRTADVSRGRDPRFNAAVIGNSTGQMIDPYRLSREAGLRFIQLSIPATGPREQLAIMRWVISHHPTYGAFVIVADLAWCSADPDLPLYTAFPFWLYGDDRTYLANVLSSKSLDRAVWRIGVALGLQQTVDPVGYYDFLKGRDMVFMPEFGDPSEDTRNLQSPPRLPWIDRLRALIAELPPNVGVVVVVPPVYFTSLPPPGSKRSAVIDACKAALAKVTTDRPRSGFLDFRVDNEAAHDGANFVDQIHYREDLARLIEAKIIAVLNSGEIGAPQARAEFGSGLDVRSP